MFKCATLDVVVSITGLFIELIFNLIRWLSFSTASSVSFSTQRIGEMLLSESLKIILEFPCWAQLELDPDC